MANESKFPNGIDTDGGAIINVANPVNPQDVATKDYVDNNTSGGLNNVILVNTIADLPTAVSGNRTFLAKTYLLDEATFTDSNTWTLVNGTQIIGQGKNVTIVNYTGTGNFINYTNATVSIFDLELQSATGTLFNVTNTSSFTTFITNVNYRNWVSLGAIAGGGFIVQYTLAVNCGTGILFSSTLGSITHDTCSYRAMTGGANSYAIKIATGSTGNSFRCYQSIFDVATNHFGIQVVGTYTLSSGGVLAGNIFSGTGAVANRVSGVNGNTTGWNIAYGANTGISGLQFTDVDVISSADATFPNTAGTVTEGGTVRAFVPTIAFYDPLATNMDGKIIGEITSAEATFQIGLRNINTLTNLGGLQPAVLPATLGSVESDYVAITPNRLYTAYYVKTSNGGGNVATRYAIKVRIKTY